MFGRPACHISIIVALWRSSYGCLGSEAKGLRFEWLRSTEASCSCLRAFSFLFYLLLELTAAGNNGFQYACLPGMPMGESFLLGVRVLLPLVAVPRQWHVLGSCVQQYFGIARLVMYHPAFLHDLQHGSIIAVTAQFILGSSNSFTRIVGVSHRWALDILTYRTLII